MKKINKLIFIVLLSIVSISCSGNKETAELKKENSTLKEQLKKLKTANLELTKQSLIQKELNKGSRATGLIHSKVLRNIVKIYSEDTLDLAKYGNEFVFKRDIVLNKLDNTSFAESLGMISERLELYGYYVYSICDGKSLPLEMCNCTDSIYIVVEPEELGEDYELYRMGLYYNIDLIDLKRVEKEDDDYDIVLTFEHGVYPRKREKVNLSKMKLEKVE